jgi:hypothetical protein
MSANKDNVKTINALFVALENAGFIYRTRIEIEEDSEGKFIRKKL